MAIFLPFIDMKEKGMSKGEFTSVAQANGGLENMINRDGIDGKEDNARSAVSGTEVSGCNRGSIMG